MRRCGAASEQAAVVAQGLVQAERESALFHLYGALLGLCHEIGGYYRLPTASSVEQLLEGDISFSETDALSKSAEQELMFQDQQAEMVQLVLRRLAAIKAI